MNALIRNPMVIVGFTFAGLLLWFADASPHLLRGQIGLSQTTFYLADAIISALGLEKSNDNLFFIAVLPVLIPQLIGFVVLISRVLRRSLAWHIPSYVRSLGVASAFPIEAVALWFLWSQIALPYPTGLEYLVLALVLIGLAIVVFTLATMQGFSGKEIAESYFGASMPRKIGAIGFVIWGIGILIFIMALLADLLTNPVALALIATCAIIGGSCVYVGMSALKSGTTQT